jgi:hypothetical protein
MRINILGLTIVTVVHQPRFEIYNKIDDVMFLGKRGRAVYLGPVKKGKVCNNS